jgi:hypothetical protein
MRAGPPAQKAWIARIDRGDAGEERPRRGRCRTHFVVLSAANRAQRGVGGGMVRDLLAISRDGEGVEDMDAWSGILNPNH